MKYEIRSLLIDNPNGAERRRICYKVAGAREYSFINYVSTHKWNRGQIVKFLCDKLFVSPEDIIWPEFLKVP